MSTTGDSECRLVIAPVIILRQDEFHTLSCPQSTASDLNTTAERVRKKERKRERGGRKQRSSTAEPPEERQE